MSGLFKVAELAVLAGLLTGGYLLLDHSRASAVPVAASEPRDKAIDKAIAAVTPASRQAPPAIAAARPPVPLQVSRRATYRVEDPQASAAAATPEQADKDKKAAADARAKAMIEADGYRNVKSLAKAPDGSWRGLAMRGTVEVAVSVDDNGRVSTQ